MFCTNAGPLCAQVRVNYEYSKWGYKSFDPMREERSCEMLLFALRRCMIRHTADAVLRLPPRTDELVPGARSIFYPHQGDAMYRVRVQYRAAAAAQDR